MIRTSIVMYNLKFLLEQYLEAAARSRYGQDEVSLSGTKLIFVMRCIFGILSEDEFQKLLILCCWMLSNRSFRKLFQKILQSSWENFTAYLQWIELKLNFLFGVSPSLSPISKPSSALPWKWISRMQIPYLYLQLWFSYSFSFSVCFLAYDFS